MTTVTVDAIQLWGESARSGIGSYVRGLLGGLARVPGVSVKALCPADVGLPPGIGRVTTRRVFREGRPALWEHEMRRTGELRLHRRGVFHNPNPHPPALPPRPWVQTLFDVIPLVLDDPAMAALRDRFRRVGPRYAKAGAVIAISRFAARQGVEHLGIDPARITVVHPGIDEHFRPGPALGAGDGAPYLSMVSEYSPRKGFGFAFEVIARLAEAGFEHRLKVAGRVPGWQRAAFERELAAARRPDRIDLLGYVTDLAPLYRGAAAHLVTSRHEGFGLSAAEAMACGTPVVAFRNSALEEVVGGGGLLVADGDVAAASEALASLARSPRRRQEVSQAGLEWSRRFNWDQAARLHCEVYRSVAIS